MPFHFGVVGIRMLPSNARPGDVAMPITILTDSGIGGKVMGIIYLTHTMGRVKVAT